MRRRILFAVEIILVSALVLLTRCANYRNVFVAGHIYFVDADCYARMTRARICFEHPGTIIRHHDFENYPLGTSPHTTAPFDYLLVAIAALLAAFGTSASLDLAGAIVSPLIAIALGIFLCWWTRRVAMRFRFALLALYAVSPILAHGTALGRPDHQSLLIALIGVALSAEWMLWRAADGKPSHPERSGAQSRDLVEITVKSPPRNPSRGMTRWAIVCGASWALAVWVSLYEPLVLLAMVTAVRAVGWFRNGDRRNLQTRAIWIVFAVFIILAAMIERRFPAWPTHESLGALRNWGGSIGELAHVPLKSSIWFQWCSWLLALTPILFWPTRNERRAPPFLIALLPVTFVLTMTQARWSYFFALVLVLLAPAILGVCRNRTVALGLFIIALFPVAQEWDRRFYETEKTTRTENRIEQIELRAIASEIHGPAVAPWWFSPALSCWSREPCVAGSSHESISGIEDCANFYAATDASEAAAICTRRQVRWIVSYDAERLAKSSAQILNSSVAENAMCRLLDRFPSRAPRFLQLVAQTARFKLYHVENNE